MITVASAVNLPKLAHYAGRTHWRNGERLCRLTLVVNAVSIAGVVDDRIPGHHA